MKIKINANVNKVLHKAAFAVRKHSPEILMVTGVTSVVASTIMACKATTKAGAIVEEARADMNDIQFASIAAGVTEMPEDISAEDKEFVEALAKQDAIAEYTEKDITRDKLLAYVHASAKFAKLYAPSIAVGVFGIGCMIASNGILRKRNIALAAAYATVDRGFKEYRKNVIDRFGEDMDKELRHNIKAKKFKEVVVDDETGEEKKVKTTVDIADPSAYSVYAKCFDEGCAGWTKDPEVNLMFLRQQQDWANEKLKAQGYLFLNDVYASLGIPKTKAGQIVGWLYDDKCPVGDNFVDFGIYNINLETHRDFVNGYERSIWLDFNVDGNILENF